MNDISNTLLDYERLFTIVIAFDSNGRIVHTSKLVQQHIQAGLENISQIAVFVRPSLKISGYSAPVLEFFRANKNSQYIFFLGADSLPVRAQFLEGPAGDDIFYLLGMPWLAKLYEQGDSSRIKLGEYPLFDSQVDMLVVQDYQKRYLDQLLSAKSNLEDAKLKEELANREKSNLLAMISHEMKTPLTSIVGALALLGKNKTSQEDNKYIAMANSAAKNLLAQINEILSFTSYEYGESKVKKSDFSVQEIIDEILLLYGSKTDRKTIKLEISSNFDAETVYYADKSKVKNILINYINNAIRHTTDGRVDIGISGITSGKSTQLKFTVKDYGPGIPKDRLESIFKPFWKFENIRSSGSAGRGFGLFICKQLTEMMGGECGVYSLDNDGSTFWASIPAEISQNTHPTVGSPQNTVQGIPKRDRLDGKKILLAEDNRLSRKIVSQILEDFGMDVTLCINGQDAVNVISNNTFDIVLLDLGMPILDGYQAIKIIRNTLSRDELPVIAFSAFSELEDMDSLLEDGFNGCIRKPIGSEELAVELAKYLPSNEPSARPAIEEDMAGQADHTIPVPYLDLSIFSKMQFETRNSDMRELVRMFSEELIAGETAIVQAYQSGSKDNLRKEAHALKGGCQAFGAIPLASLMKEIELQASGPSADVTISKKAAQVMIRNTVAALANMHTAQIV